MVRGLFDVAGGKLGFLLAVCRRGEPHGSLGLPPATFPPPTVAMTCPGSPASAAFYRLNRACCATALTVRGDRGRSGCFPAVHPRRSALPVLDLFSGEDRPASHGQPRQLPAVVGRRAKTQRASVMLNQFDFESAREHARRGCGRRSG